MIGAAGAFAVPMAARVVQRRTKRKTRQPLINARNGTKRTGVIGSAIVAGLLAFFL